jgi:hypothetical protein
MRQMSVHTPRVNKTVSDTEPRLFQLTRRPNRIAGRDFEIEFLDPGVEAFDSTFG